MLHSILLLGNKYIKAGWFWTFYLQGLAVCPIYGVSKGFGVMLKMVSLNYSLCTKTFALYWILPLGNIYVRVGQSGNLHMIFRLIYQPAGLWHLSYIWILRLPHVYNVNKLLCTNWILPLGTKYVKVGQLWTKRELALYLHKLQTDRQTDRWTNGQTSSYFEL